MELTQTQINKFIEIHKGHPEFEMYTEAEVREIANGVASYYRTLFRIYRKLEMGEKLDVDMAPAPGV